MSAARVRIGKITLKAGGASIRQLQIPERAQGVKEVVEAARKAGEDLTTAGQLCEDEPFTPEISGYVVFVYGWDEATGTYAQKTKWNQCDARIPAMLLPNLVEAALRACIEDKRTSGSPLWGDES